VTRFRTLLAAAAVAGALLTAGTVIANAAARSGGAKPAAVQPADIPGRCVNWCRLISYRNPALCLDADTTHLYQDGDKVQLWGCNFNWNQQWRASQSADELGGRYLINRADSMCLDADNAHIYQNGAAVTMWHCGNGAYNQHWRYYTTHGAYTGQFVNMGSGKCLDADAAYIGNGDRIQQWSCSGGSNQSWTLVDG
jgi:hypothetical protein